VNVSAIDERVRQLVAAHRPEIERLVDQALERELNELVEQRLAAGNGEPAAKPFVLPATTTTRVCEGCGETKPAGAFEKYRRRCRECRRRDRRTAAAAEPGRPTAIAPAELLARVEHNNTRARHLIGWLLREHLAERTPGGLVATAKTRELAAGLG
jgi:hypothetical protein